jgi:hypothetical protein
MFKLLTSKSKTSKKGLIPNPPQKQANNINQNQYHNGGGNQGYNNAGMNYNNHNNSNMYNDMNRGYQQPNNNGYRSNNNHNNNKPLPPSPHYPSRPSNNQHQQQYQDYSPHKPTSIQSHIQSHQSYIHNNKHSQPQYQGGPPPPSHSYQQYPPQHQGHSGGYPGQPQAGPYSNKGQANRVPPLRSNNLQYTQFSSSSAAAAKMDQRNAPRQNTPLQKLLIPPIEVDSDNRYHYDQASPTRYNDPLSPSRYDPLSPSPLRADDRREYDRRRPTSHYQVQHPPEKIPEQEYGREPMQRSKNISVPNDLGDRYRRDGRSDSPNVPHPQERTHSLYSPIR